MRTATHFLATLTLILGLISHGSSTAAADDGWFIDAPVPHLDRLVALGPCVGRDGETPLFLTVTRSGQAELRYTITFGLDREACLFADPRRLVRTVVETDDHIDLNDPRRLDIEVPCDGSDLGASLRFDFDDDGRLTRVRGRARNLGGLPYRGMDATFPKVPVSPSELNLADEFIGTPVPALETLARTGTTTGKVGRKPAYLTVEHGTMPAGGGSGHYYTVRLSLTPAEGGLDMRGTVKGTAFRAAHVRTAGPRRIELTAVEPILGQDVTFALDFDETGTLTTVTAREKLLGGIPKPAMVAHFGAELQRRNFDELHAAAR